MREPTIIFDIDGTVANVSKRVKHLQGEVRDWEKFYEGFKDDEVIRPIADLLRAVDRSYQPFFQLVCVTARPERTWDATLRWFEEKVGDEPYKLFMRNDDDDRPEVEVKRSWIEFLRRERYNIVLAFANREEIVKMYLDMGIPCCRVHVPECRLQMSESSVPSVSEGAY